MVQSFLELTAVLLKANEGGFPKNMAVWPAQYLLPLLLCSHKQHASSLEALQPSFIHPI